MAIKSKSDRIQGHININVILAFVFGVVFLATMLGFATFIPNPSPFQIRIFITTLALAASGIGSVIPGFIEIQYQNIFRAGGAIALFILVYAFQPVIKGQVINFIPPKQSPAPTILAYLSDIDAGNIDEAWAEIDAVSKGLIVQDKSEFVTIYKQARDPLGPTVSRQQNGSAGATNLPGVPEGIYRAMNFITKFRNEDACRSESVIVRATSDLEWRVFDHTIAPMPVPCPPTADENTAGRDK